MKKIILFLIFVLPISNLFGQDVEDLDLEDPEDINFLMDDLDESSEKDSTSTTPVKKKAEEAVADDPDSIEDDLEELGVNDTAKEVVEKEDDLDSLKDDIGDIEFLVPQESEREIKLSEKREEQKSNKKKIEIVKDGDISSKEMLLILDVGKLEKDLLEMAKGMQGKIPNSEWNEIAGKSTEGTYEVSPGDWLWKISKKIFGSGFFYSKIWALNPYITNPHEIEPGMMLTFTTGSDSNLPSLEVQKARQLIVNDTAQDDGYSIWGDDSKPPWIDERERMKNQGVYFQYSTGDTQEDLKQIGDRALIKDYESYEPPKLDFSITAPASEYDSTGFDKNSKISFKTKEGFYLNTFLSNNIVQDFGKVESSHLGKSLFLPEDIVYVRFDKKMEIVPGDKFSVYIASGELTHKNSDRTGFKYTISGSFEVVEKHEGLWKSRILDVVVPIARGDRITVFTPQIERITKSFNSRLIESVLMSSYEELQTSPSFGDVVYLDRGRADGVEMGNVFEVYGFKDRGTGKFITKNPTYKNGELTVITVTDNFSTALVTKSNRDFQLGDLAITKTKEAAARTTKIKNQSLASNASRIDTQALDELDIELNLDSLNDNLLDKADKIQFTEEELAELDRQEREKSVLSENEKDLRSLERLETELETAEKMLNEARLDEDKLLEDQDLNVVEKDVGVDQQESLDELEENFGKRYLDEDLNDKENPYGLTEFDIEEVDELLNADKESE